MKAEMRFDKKKLIWFTLTVGAAWLLIFVFNVLTPMMTDDLFYAKTVAGASGFFGLVQQEYEQYMTWSGRSVVHLILRLFLRGPKMLFNLCNATAFVVLALCMYWNVSHRRKADVRLFLLINLLVWMYAAVFKQTVLWETGACNYLWGTTIIMVFVTLYRRNLNRVGIKESAGHQVLLTAAMFFLGIPAGWCNENTSGGGVLLTMIYLLLYLMKAPSSIQRSKLQLNRLRPWMVTGLLGQFVGLAVMVLAPGNAIRSALQEPEEHTGMLAYAARFQKTTLALRDNFMPLLVLAVILCVILCVQKGKNQNWPQIWQQGKDGFIWIFVFCATSYSLILTTQPMPRAYFGAGIFLMIACANMYADISENESVLAMVKISLVAVLVLVMGFTYLESGANLARIYREYQERNSYLAEQAANGVKDVTVPMLRPDFETKYSDGYDSDITEDSEYWINVAYANYYGFDSVTGVDREGWDRY